MDDINKMGWITVIQGPGFLIRRMTYTNTDMERWSVAHLLPGHHLLASYTKWSSAWAAWERDVPFRVTIDV